MSTVPTIGQQVVIKPSRRDEGDERYSWTVITEPNATGHFKVRVVALAPDRDSFSTVMELHLSDIEPSAA
jgi:hypothetical protein